MKKKPAKNPHKSSQSTGPDMKTEIGQLIRKNNLSLCLECGKCSAVCPMLEFYGEYSYDRSPRGVVERLSFNPEKIDDEALWYCLTCRECTFFCPSGVIFQDFMTELRECLIDHGYKEYALFCPTCGSYLMPQKEFESFQKNPDSGKISELLTICPQCKKNNYAETLYRFAPLRKSSKSHRKTLTIGGPR